MDEVEKKEFLVMCRFQMRLPVEQRLKKAFVKVTEWEKKNRVFRTMQEYQEFCEKHYPKWRGYKRAKV